MKKNVFGRKLGRDTNERKALFKSLANALVIEERIKTTEGKAKAVRGYVEKLVTKAKKGGVHAHRLLQPHLRPDALKKMLEDVAPRFQNRQGGYTRIVKLGNRFADNAPVVLLEWVELRTMALVPTPGGKRATRGQKAAADTANAVQAVAVEKKPKAKKKTEKPAPKKAVTKTVKKTTKKKDK
ncbi:MAG: 50S ribosomal protein L17 [Candidatus Levybacteria bacterium]|nr:50S ribosomal protein L17 [Candidatus Levybacteria bacterium]